MPEPEPSTAPSPVFKQAFLRRFSTEDRHGLRHLAKLLSELPESSDSEKSPVAQEFAAALVDLEFTADLLEEIEGEPERTLLNKEDIASCRSAGRLARGLRKLLRETNA